MRRPARPQSAGLQGKRVPSSDARAASRDRKDAATSAPKAGSTRQRPLSAQARRESPHARREALNAEKALQTLQEQCLDLKRSANSFAEENTKAKTRLRVLERELQRRERLLRQLAALKKSGQGVDADVIEKLREERNTLPLVRKKAQDLAQQVEQRDQEIKELKRDPQFTRIIELQVEYATWQHEAKRLHSLMQEASPEVSSVARQEIEVHERRVGQLEVHLDKVVDNKDKVAAEVQGEEADHADWLQQYQEKEKELQDQQELTRELAIDFKKVLQERKQVEQMEDEIEQMKINNQKYEQELAAASAQQGPQKGGKTPLGRASVSHAARTCPLPDGHTLDASLLRTLRRAMALRAGENSVFAEFLRRDTDCDGLLSYDELAQALAMVGVGGCSPEDLTTLLALAPAAVGSPPSHVRWLDLLVLLDRSASTPSPPVALPPLGPLRAACLRNEVRIEEFQCLCAISSSAEAEAFFAGLGLESSVGAMWEAAFEAYGPDGLLLRLPIGEVAIDQADFDAWFLRCVDAVRKHRKDLLDALAVWRADMHLEQEQFSMVCCDVLGLELSQDDVADLALFLSGGGAGPIDGRRLLQIEELRRPR